MSDISPIPEGVDIDSLSLSVEEIKAYPRWYTDLLLRKGKQSVAVGDVLSFLDNFGVKDSDKQLILNMYVQPLVTLDPAQFYIFLRLASHLLEGVTELTPGFGFVDAPVPRPKSILSRKRKSVTPASSSPTLPTPPTNPFRRQPESSLSGDSTGSHPKMDIDMFKTFILTGNRPSSDDETQMVKSPAKRKKRVTFDNRPPEVAEAAARSMDELLRQRGTARAYVAPQLPSQFDYSSLASVSSDNTVNGTSAPQIVVGDNYNGNGGDNENEEEEEEDVEIDENAFKNVNIDSVLHHGVSIPETSFNHFSTDSPSPGISPSPSPDLSGPVVPIQEQRTGPPPPPPRSRFGGAFTDGGRSSPELSSTGVPSGRLSIGHSPSPPFSQNNFLSPQYQPSNSALLPNGFHTLPNFQAPHAPQTTQFSSSPVPSTLLQVPINSHQTPPPPPQQRLSQSGVGGIGSGATPQIAQGASPSPPIQQQFLQPVPTGSTYQRPAPPIHFRSSGNLSSALPPPPPPQPRRSVSGNPAFTVGQPIQSGPTRQFNGPPLPPPPPPARNRAPSLPPAPSAAFFSANPMSNLNVAATSSEPNLVADLRTLQEEVNRLSRK
jgi:hypothetical protein